MPTRGRPEVARQAKGLAVVELAERVRPRGGGSLERGGGDVADPLEADLARAAPGRGAAGGAVDALLVVGAAGIGGEGSCESEKGEHGTSWERVNWHL